MKTLTVGIVLFTTALFGLFYSPNLECIELKAEANNKHLIVTVTDVKYPDDITEKELSSGLPNDITLIVSISHQGNKVFALSANYQITYDLWDEVYRVKITDSLGKVFNKSIGKKQQVMAFIEQLTIENEMAIAGLQDNVVYNLSAQVLVNPVKRERINKIKAWIADSQGYSYSNDSESDASVVSGNPASTVHNYTPGEVNASLIINKGTAVEHMRSARPRFQKLFDQILEQYVTAGEVPALWRSQVKSTAFSLTSLLNEKQND